MAEKKAKSRTVKYTLIYPAEWGEETITELEFGRPRGKDLKRIQQNMNLGDVIDIASRICTRPDITPKFFDRLDGEDYMEIAELVQDFLDSSQRTGRR